MLILTKTHFKHCLHMQRLLILLVLISLAIPASSVFAKKLYTWTDKDGVKHITDRPPPPGANVKSVVRDRPGPIVVKVPGAAKPARTEGRNAIESLKREAEIAWQKAEADRQKTFELQGVFEDATAAVVAERAKFRYSADRRRAPRQVIIDKEEIAQKAFRDYRKALDTFRLSEKKAIEAEKTLQSAIDALNRKKEEEAAAAQ